MTKSSLNPSALINALFRVLSERNVGCNIFISVLVIVICFNVGMDVKKGISIYFFVFFFASIFALVLPVGIFYYFVQKISAGYILVPIIGLMAFHFFEPAQNNNLHLFLMAVEFTCLLIASINLALTIIQASMKLAELETKAFLQTGHLEKPILRASSGKLLFCVSQISPDIIRYSNTHFTAICITI